MAPANGTVVASGGSEPGLSTIELPHARRLAVVNRGLFELHSRSNLYKSASSLNIAIDPPIQVTKDIIISAISIRSPQEPTMRFSTILSVPLLPAAVLAGPVAAPAKPLDVGPLPFPNPIALYFEMMGAPSCSVCCPSPPA